MTWKGIYNNTTNYSAGDVVYLDGTSYIATVDIIQDGQAFHPEKDDAWEIVAQQGANGASGASVTVKSVNESSTDGGSNVVTFSDGKTLTIKNGAKGSTGATGSQGPKGDTGSTGATGAQGPAGQNGKDGVSATHSWNGTTLTVTSASGTSSADLKGAKGDKGDKGDQGEKGETGAAGSNGKDGANGTSVTVKSVTESTEDGGSNVVAFSDGKTLTVKNGIDGYSPVRGVDYYTDADKAEFEAIIADEMVKRGQLKPEFANSSDECTDTSKLYVLPDGYIYAYMRKTVYTEHNVYDGTDNTLKRNYRVTGLETETPTNGSVSTYKIAVDNSWSSCNVTFKGMDTLYVIDYAPFYVHYYDKDGNLIVKLDPKKYGLTTNNQVDFAVPDEGLTFNIALASYNGKTVWSNTAYVRFQLHLSKSAVYIDNPLLETLKINVAPLNASEEVTAWSNTGHMFTTDQYGQAIEQNTANIESLQVDVLRLKKSVQNVPKPSDTVWYAIGDSITAGYGVGNTSTSEYDKTKSWVQYVLDYNGYDKGHSLNLGLPGMGFCRESYGHTARSLVDATDFTTVDLVTIALGINDWKSVYSLDTMKTEMRYCFEKIFADNPYCKIVFIAPFNISKKGSLESNWALGYSGDDVTGGITLQAFIDIQRTICEEYGVQVVDINKDGIINRHNINAVLYDTVHPDEVCHKALGRELARRITFA
jgi:lysophospholipase L1-like esterase